MQVSKAGRKTAPRDKDLPPQLDQALVVYNTMEARQKLKCGKTTLYKLLASGQLKYHKMGSRTVVFESDLRAFLVALPPGIPNVTAV